MRWLAASLTLLAVQEAPDRDLATTYRAISDLVDRPDEGASQKLSPFHRLVLASELRTKEELGNLHGSASRIQVKGKSLTFGDYAEKVNQLTGWNLSKGNPPAEKRFDFDADGWPLEVAVLLAERAGLQLSFEWAWKDLYIPGYSSAGEFRKKVDRHRWFFFRNFAVSAEAGGWHKEVDFAGPPIWSVDVAGQIRGDPSLKVLRCIETEVLEALDEKGRALSWVRPVKLSIPREEESIVWKPPMGFSFRLAAEGATSLSRLRIKLRIAQATEIRRYVVTKFDPAAPVRLSDGFFDIAVSVEQGSTAATDCVAAKIVPKKERHADLADIPFYFGHAYDKPGAAGIFTRFTGNGVGTSVQSGWCTVRPADQVDPSTLEAYRGVRRPIKVELAIPVGIRERTIYAEFRDIPLK